MNSTNQFFEGYCPDLCCNERLLFMSNTNNTFVPCHYCGQIFDRSMLKCVNYIEKSEGKLLYDRIVSLPKRSGFEWTRVNGISPFICKVISPVFGVYGIDRNWKPKYLIEMGMSGIFDTKLLADRSYEIDEVYLTAPGFGRDLESYDYLLQTLTEIGSFQESNRLEPLTVTGNGNCLLMAISRALVGREIFWHPLMLALSTHLNEFEIFYRQFLDDYLIEDDWEKIVNYIADDYVLQTDRLSLHNVLLFAVANLLRRPIILLDSMTYMTIEFADFSAVFLPVLRQTDDCRNKSGHLNLPIVIAWSDNQHRRFVPLIRVKGEPHPILSTDFLPNVWLVDHDLIFKYMEFDDNYCEVAGGRITKDRTINRMIKIMENVFIERSKLSPQMLSDYFEDLLNTKCFKYSCIEPTKEEIFRIHKEAGFWRCLICWRLNKSSILPRDFLEPGGLIYETLKKKGATFRHGESYYLCPIGEFIFDRETCSLRVSNVLAFTCLHCKFNHWQLRRQYSDERIRFLNGDHTRTPSIQSKCKRKMKHFYNGIEYDNPPLLLDITCNSAKTPFVDVKWFKDESNPVNNSDINELATNFISCNFPDIEKGSMSYETVFNSVVDEMMNIIKMTESNWCCGYCVCNDSNWDLRHTNFIPMKSDELNPRIFYENFVKCYYKKIQYMKNEKSKISFH